MLNIIINIKNTDRFKCNRNENSFSGDERSPIRNGDLRKRDLKKFEKILKEKKAQLLNKARRTLTEDMQLDPNELPDEMDLASTEYLQSFTFRLRGREKTFLKKIDIALGKLDEGSFGVCDECGEGISLKRLEARPETTMCIRCKEEQEQKEKAFG